MEIVKIITLIFGATGFWQLLTIALKYRSEKKLKNAELNSINTTTEKHIINNWVQWSQKLEERLKASEDMNEKLTKKISCLEKKMREFVKKNKELIHEIIQLRNEGKDTIK